MLINKPMIYTAFSLLRCISKLLFFFAFYYNAVRIAGI